MSWSYSGDPSSSELDEVRFLLQDVEPDRQLMADEGIEYWLTKLQPLYDSVLLVAAQCADTLSARFAIEVSQSADGVSIGADQLQTKYTQLAADLREQNNRIQGVGAEPYVGSNDRSHLAPGERAGWAAVGQHDNPEAGIQDSSDRDYYYGYPEPGT